MRRRLYWYASALCACALASFVHAEDGLNERLNLSSNGEQGNGESSSISISADGRYVAFSSSASNLVFGDTNAKSDIFMLDREDGTISKVSVSASGGGTNGDSGSAFISASGRFIVFTSDASNIVSGDTNQKIDCFVYDRELAATERVSVSNDGAQADDDCLSPSISDDGVHVAFASAATTLVAGDTNDKIDVFLRDRAVGSTSIVSAVASDLLSDGDSLRPRISADGAVVVFDSDATNLVTASAQGQRQVYLHDIATDKINLISVRYRTGVGGSGDSVAPVVSDSSRYVVFESSASNLVLGDVNSVNDCFLYDRQEQSTELMSKSSAGVLGDAACSSVDVTADGRYVVFQSAATNLVSADSNGFSDIFVADREDETVLLISDSTGNGSANGNSVLPAIEDEGNVVVFLSDASNLVADDTNAARDALSTENDICRDDAAKTNPGQCGCGSLDTDSDGDAVSDCADRCPADSSKAVAGLCGCGVPDSDADASGSVDCLEPTADTVPKAAKVSRAASPGVYRITLQAFPGFAYEVKTRDLARGRISTRRVRNGNSYRSNFQQGSYRITYKVLLRDGSTSKRSRARVFEVQ